MSAAAEVDLLYPLSRFRQRHGASLPNCVVVSAAEVPPPYHQLLVHEGDMTSRLEAFHGGDIVLSVLHRGRVDDRYEREVILRMEETGLPVEYGAIEIELDELSAPLREKILQEHLPFGGLLNAYGVRYFSRPRAFLKFTADQIMGETFRIPTQQVLYGRSNELLSAEGRVIARILEVLRP